SACACERVAAFRARRRRPEMVTDGASRPEPTPQTSQNSGGSGMSVPACGTIRAVTASPDPSAGRVATTGTDRSQPPTGTAPPVVGGRYQIITELAGGGMGSVYRVLDRLTGRVITLKQLNVATTPPASVDSRAPEERLALAQEFRAVASLRHPNIISVLD